MSVNIFLLEVFDFGVSHSSITSTYVVKKSRKSFSQKKKATTEAYNGLKYGFESKFKSPFGFQFPNIVRKKV